MRRAALFAGGRTAVPDECASRRADLGRPPAAHGTSTMCGMGLAEEYAADDFRSIVPVDRR